MGCVPPPPPPLLVEPPPQEVMKSNKVSDASPKHRRMERLETLIPGQTTIPIAATVHNHGIGVASLGRSAPMVRDVVVTVTVKVAGEVALNASVAGTVHFAPIGAPLQLKEAVPEAPAPPIESV